MNRVIFTAAFLLGATFVVWMGSGFIGTDPLALAVIAVIGCVYTVGFIELIRFRMATATLTYALSAVGNELTVVGNELTNEDSKVSGSKVTDLGDWLSKLHGTLQNPVRLRIEGERFGLPVPVLTPYLVGLLVMLGLLGTFAGMVDTLKGAVYALEGTTELQAIRAGLAAPIKGLGLAFGTSVAGVAASAMLGLLSTLSRRDRLLATRQLDNKITHEFREFSLVHNRQETYKALQAQSQAIPDVAEKLHVMTSQLEVLGDRLVDKLISSQSNFHESTKTIFADLASSVDQSLKKSVAENSRLIQESSRISQESGRLAGESIKPLIQSVMKDITLEVSNGAKTTHTQLSQTVENQLGVLTEQFSLTTSQVSDAWKVGLSEHNRTNDELITGMSEAFIAFSGQFNDAATSVIDSFDKTALNYSQRQQTEDKLRLKLWLDTIELSQQESSQQLTASSNELLTALKNVTSEQAVSYKDMSSELSKVSSSLINQLRDAGENSIIQQEKMSTALQGTAAKIAEHSNTTSHQLLEEVSGLLSASEDLVKTRISSEQSWLSQHSEQMIALSSAMKTEFSSLRDDEQKRGQVALDRLAELESTVAKHLITLGTALEEPMTRLIETASETPRAAAEVIGHLRTEISNNIERDNSLLDERRTIMADLNTLFSTLEQTSSGQRDAIQQLVDSSANTLNEVGERFTTHVGTEVLKLNEIGEHFAGSATEMASLGDAFTLAVELFNSSNNTLIDNLNRIETSLEQSSVRSDEQLGYYIAQAREIIDHSMLSQKELFEELRQLGRPEQLAPESVN